ncbi:hypothetical protein SAMN02745157_1460 [Kaistia soli DSM 19436]|uniref:Uncharacterized protein n=1 Tax=Kaistia soli DSM 19436 TaxID=1122133 RepID=A0A1M4Y9G4_9HYPH|nr:hypothetical protein [Kaistia soli]SHF02300.1 hypothetical protein SAMN02745157_1460 [Kaistia soli DSM 19436]
MRDLLNSIHPVRAISPAAAVADNTPIVSQIIDTAGYESLTFLILIGALADADAAFAVSLTHGDAANLSDGVAVPAANILGGLANANFTFSDDDKVRKVGYLGSKRYVRLTITPANNTGNAFVSALALLGAGRFRPTSNPPA